MSDTHDLKKIRLMKMNEIEKIQDSCWISSDKLLEKLEKKDNSFSIKYKYKRFSKEELEEKNIKTTVFARVVTIRGPFVICKDATGIIQGYVNIKQYPKLKGIFNLIDRGDFLMMNGCVSKTKTKQLMIKVQNLLIISKSLLPVPEVFYGLKDVEEKYRKRYLDLLINDETKKVFITRSKILRIIRDYFDSKKYLEVDTPILQSVASGASAKPFKTYHNSLKQNLYLRIATELPLKKLLVGGYEKVYEIGRVFRNEGIDSTHNPEFTTIEFYEAYTDYHKMMWYTENLIKRIAKKTHKKTILINDKKINLMKKFKVVKLIDSVNKKLRINAEELSVEQLKEIAIKNKIKIESFYKKGHIIFQLFDHLVSKFINEPTFIIDFPIEVSPFAAKTNYNNKITQRAELYIGGREYANMFTELHNPIDQLNRFKKQLEEKKTGNDEASEIEYDFVNALEYGMPPAGGCGIGIDRLVMLFTEKQSIREVLLFPHLKEKNK